MLDTTQIIKRGASLFTVGLVVLSSSAAFAQSHSMNHGSMDMGSMDMPGMNHGAMDMGNMNMNMHGTDMKGGNHGPEAMEDGMKMPSRHEAMQHGAMDHGSMDMNNMQHEDMGVDNAQGAASMSYRSDSAALVQASGCEKPVKIDPATGAPACWPKPVMDQMPFGKVLIDQLELGYTDGADSYSWEADAWWGDDYDKIWFKTEGEGLQYGEVEAAEIQLLYSRLISPYFDLQAGLRYDLEPEDERGFAVLGVQGLAPYWFETDTALFVSEDGDVSFRGEFEYELLFTQRLILTPSLEFTVAAQDVPEYGLGSGLRSTELGLRLRYEIKREFAPYIGVSYEQLYGDTADIAEARGGDDSRTAFVVGVRAWF